jgi:hypothetical protein
MKETPSPAPVFSQPTVFFNEMNKRYKSAYLVAKAIKLFSSIFAIIGIIASVFTTCEIFSLVSKLGDDSNAVQFIIIFAIQSFLVVIVSKIIEAFGCVLMAVLDTAVNTNESLTKEEKIAIF